MRRKHVHKYHKVELEGGYSVWACSYCNHYMPQHLERLIPGRQSLCWNCGETIVLNAMNMKYDKPTCEECAPNADKQVSQLVKQLETGKSIDEILALISDKSKWNIHS